MNTKEVVEKELADLDMKLATIDPHTQSAEYENLLKIRSMLLEQREKSPLAKIDPNIVVRFAGTGLLVGAMMLFESFGHIFTSKSFGFLPRNLF